MKISNTNLTGFFCEWANTIGPSASPGTFDSRV